MNLPLTLTSGTMIGGHYIIGDLINRGGFGAVYRGVDTSEGNRFCAIKETYNVTPSTRRQALMEASVLFTFRNAHLPQVYDAFEANGRFYLVMQLIEGQNLLQLLRSRVPGGLVGEQEPYQVQAGPCSEQEVLTWFLPIVDVLRELHSRKPPVMHRDIKPGNIILTPHNQAVLVDFGLTKLYDPDVSTQTLGRAVSEGFSPLEQYVGKTTPQSDIYSLAATMYLLLTNRLPPIATKRSVQDELIAPHFLNPAISPKMERVLLKALELQADQRFPDMADFAAALREPAFAAYNDNTVAVSPQQLQTLIAPQQPTQAPISLPGTPAHSYPAQSQVSYPGLPAYPPPSAQAQYFPGSSVQHYGQQQMMPQNAPFASPFYGPQVPASPQGYPPQQPYSSPGYPYTPLTAPTQQPQGARTQQPVSPVDYRSLPTPSGQGCLWGAVQGLLAALFILFSHQPADFYLATLFGFFFYFVAGFFTSWRGGGSLRGGWGGYWTGIIGTVVFWLAFGLGLAVTFVQHLQDLNRTSSDLGPQAMNARAWSEVQPLWPAIPYLFPAQPPLVNVAALLLIGVVVAWFFGWFGGMVGVSRYRSKKKP